MIKSTGLSLAGIRGEFFRQIDQVQAFPWEQFCETIQSSAASEKYRGLGAAPLMREWGTGRLLRGIRAESYDVDNLKYEASIEADRDEISDDQVGMIMMRIKALAASAKRHKAYLLSQLLINGATAGFNSYDAVTFFNAAHVSGDSGSQDNDLTATAAAATKTTAECKTALQAAIETLMSFKNDRGEPMNEDASGLVVVVPPAGGLYYAMKEAASATVISQTSNVLASDNINVVMLPWLTLGTTWYLTKLNGLFKPFFFQDREPLEFSSLEKDSETGVLREVYVYGVRARYRLTYGFWQYCVRTVFSA